MVRACGIAHPLRSEGGTHGFGDGRGTGLGGYVTLGSGSAHRWARQRGAEFDAAVLPVLDQHLLRTRVARTLGVTLGIGTSMMLLARYNADPESFTWYLDVWLAENPLWLSALGYVMASVVTELTKPRPLPATKRLPDAESPPDTYLAPRAAILSRRGLAEFLDPFVGRALALSTGAMLAITGLGAWVVAVEGRGWAMSGSRAHVALLAAAGMVAVIAATAIAHRREVAPNNVSLAYEELTRTATINALAGTAAAMFMMFGVRVMGLAVGPTQAIVFEILGVIGTLFALSLWVSSGTSLVFRSRRLNRIRGAA